jgi:hypothetical protein
MAVEVLRCRDASGSVEHCNQGLLRVRNSARHSSLKARSGSIAPLFISFRNSGNVLFGAKYVSTIILTTTTAFSTTAELERTAHSAYQGIDADQRRNLRLVMHQGVGVQLGCLIDVQLLASSLVL